MIFLFLVSSLPYMSLLSQILCWFIFYFLKNKINCLSVWLSTHLYLFSYIYFFLKIFHDSYFSVIVIFIFIKEAKICINILGLIFYIQCSISKMCPFFVMANCYWYFGKQWTSPCKAEHSQIYKYKNVYST